MLLKDLIKNIDDAEVIGDLNLEISDIKIDSNSVMDGTLYIALKGKEHDGHSFIRVVENYGAKAIITEKKLDTTLCQVIVKDSRIAMCIVAKEFYNRPDEKVKFIGVIGTNGKTTSTHFIKSILDTAGKKCGLIGTLGYFYGSYKEESTLTTPDPLELYKILAEMVENDVEYVVMEVSAHAIKLNKVYGINFDVAIFTNFTQDHLDYFESMEEYKRTKLSFFDKNFCKYILANSDDEVGREIINKYKGVISYGIKNPADVFAVNIKKTENGSKFIINLFDCIYDVNLNMIGDFNISNALGAATATALIGIDCDNVVNGLENLKCVSGRLEKVELKDYNVFIDYAHTPDGLYKALNTLKQSCKGKLICVFGCGGNRDKSKRKLMGKISGEVADYTIVTSDNPRFEEPMDIIFEIEKGILEVTKNYILIQDRAEAIKYALESASKLDYILIAGKGGENYQEILGIKHQYNDKDKVKEIYKKLKGWKLI